MSGQSSRPWNREFTIFGFPTRIHKGFGVLLLFLLFVYPAPLSYWVALSMAIFTFVHELGHALAARRAGCRARISLDFVFAYASYSSSRELNWGEKIFITIAGPALQLALSLIVLLSLGVNPFSRADIASSYVSAAVWWSGFALGILNLIPLVPLDGGAIVSAIAEHFAPGKGRLAVLYISFGATIGLFCLLLIADTVGLVPLCVFLLMMQWQQISQPRKMKALVQDAELQASGDPFVDGMIIDALVSANETSKALAFAREAYIKCPSFTNAFASAVLSLQFGRSDDAVMWLQAAERSQIIENELKTAMATNSQFVVLRGLPGVSDEWFTHS